jgi:hypothetical protein
VRHLAWQKVWTAVAAMGPAIEKVSDEMGMARHLSVCGTVPNCFACPFVMGLSRNAGGGLVQHRPPDMFCEGLQVLHDGGEMETLWAPR